MWTWNHKHALLNYLSLLSKQFVYYCWKCIYIYYALKTLIHYNIFILNMILLRERYFTENPDKAINKCSKAVYNSFAHILNILPTWKSVIYINIFKFFSIYIIYLCYYFILYIIPTWCTSVTKHSTYKLTNTYTVLYVYLFNQNMIIYIDKIILKHNYSKHTPDKS